jgi:hypothetical protein
LELTRPLIQDIDGMRFRYRHRAAVGRFADMPGARPRGIYFPGEIALANFFFQDTLGQGGPADIA